MTIMDAWVSLKVLQQFSEAAARRIG
jgi:hypothetical protein